MDAATVHILNNEQVYNELRPDMRTSPDIMTEREAAAYAEAEEGASSQMDRDVNDFLDSVFAGLDENIAVNERRDAMAAPYVQQLTGAGYTEKQAGHLARFLVANAEIMGAVHGVSPETFLAENFGGIAETTPEMFSMTLAEWEGKMRRQMARAPLAERDPLLAAVRGRIDPASIKAYDPQGAGELVRKYGGLFRSKDKGGLPLDVVADGLVRDGLLPEGSGANELLAALQDRREKTFFQPVNEDVDPGKAVPVIAAETESAPVWQSMKGRERKAIVNAIAGDILNEATGEIISLSRKNAAHLISSATSRGVGGPAHIAAVRNVQELLRVAERIESYPDRKNQEDVQVVHRFFAPMQYDDAVFTVNMAVKEYGGERTLEIDGVKKLYDLKLEKKTPVLLADTPAPEGNLRLRPTDVSGITIGQMLEGVNDSQGNVYFQTAYQGSARGAEANRNSGDTLLNSCYFANSGDTLLNPCHSLYL